MLTVAEENHKEPVVEEEPQDRPSWRWRLSVIGLFLLALLLSGASADEFMWVPVPRPRA